MSQWLSPGLSHSLFIAQKGTILHICKKLYNTYIALIHCKFSHTEVSFAPHCGNTCLQETVFCLSTGLLHTNMQYAFWLLLSSVVDLAFTFDFLGTKAYSTFCQRDFQRCYSTASNQGQQRLFLDEIEALILSCHSMGQQCTHAWMAVGVPGHSTYFSHIAIRTDYSLANILELLSYWELNS